MHRIGLIGLGKIGTVHARNIAENPNLSLTAVFDPVESRQKAFAEQYGAKAPATLADLLSLRDVDAVIVGSSTDTHSDVAIASARAGKAIYCEKPIDLSLEKAIATVRAVRQTEVPVMMGFNRRYDESHAALHRAVKDGSIGRLQILQMTSRGPNTAFAPEYIRVSGGFYRDKGVHFFDLLRFIAGDEALEISAMGACISDAFIGELGDVDTAIMSVRLKGGGLCQIDNTRRATYGYDERIEVLGTKGLIESGRAPSSSLMRTAGTDFVLPGIHQDIFERFGRTYAAAMAAFGRFLSDRSEPVPTLEDGLAAQVLAEAATMSARHSRVVRIAEVCSTTGPAGQIELNE